MIHEIPGLEARKKLLRATIARNIRWFLVNRYGGNQTDLAYAIWPGCEAEHLNAIRLQIREATRPVNDRNLNLPFVTLIADRFGVPIEWILERHDFIDYSEPIRFLGGLKQRRQYDRIRGSRGKKSSAQKAKLRATRPKDVSHYIRSKAQ